MQPLSPRQLDIGRRIAWGNKQIANDLGISRHMVKNELTLIYARLDCQVIAPGARRVEALLRLLYYKYLPLSEMLMPPKRLPEEDNY